MSKMGDLKTSLLIEPFMEAQDDKQALSFSAFQNANAPGPSHFFIEVPMSQYGTECISACFCVCIGKHYIFPDRKQDSGVFLKYCEVEGYSSVASDFSVTCAI